MPATGRSAAATAALGVWLRRWLLLGPATVLCYAFLAVCLAGYGLLRRPPRAPRLLKAGQEGVPSS